MINNLELNQQDILLSTLHFQDSVLEIYINKEKNTIYELFHLADHRVNVYEYEVDQYLQTKRNTKSIEEKINGLLELNH